MSLRIFNRIIRSIRSFLAPPPTETIVGLPPEIELPPEVAPAEPIFLDPNEWPAMFADIETMRYDRRDWVNVYSTYNWGSGSPIGVEVPIDANMLIRASLTLPDGTVYILYARAPSGRVVTKERIVNAMKEELFLKLREEGKGREEFTSWYVNHAMIVMDWAIERFYPLR